MVEKLVWSVKGGALGTIVEDEGRRYRNFEM